MAVHRRFLCSNNSKYFSYTICLYLWLLKFLWNMDSFREMIFLSGPRSALTLPKHCPAIAMLCCSWSIVHPKQCSGVTKALSMFSQNSAMIQQKHCAAKTVLPYVTEAFPRHSSWHISLRCYAAIIVLQCYWCEYEPVQRYR